MEHPDNKKPKRKWKSIIKKGILYMTLSGFLIYHGLQFNYNKKQLADFLYPPKEFREFKKHTNIKLSGFEENIDNQELINIALILNNEKLAKKDLSSIIIESENYKEKSVQGKLLDKYDFHGLANPITNTITLKGTSTKLFIHELAHIKTYAQIKLFKDTEFVKEWEKIQEKSKYKYFTFKEKQEHIKLKKLLKKIQVDSIKIEDIKKDSLDILKSSVDKLSKESLDSSGYVTNYSRFSMYEDIAELTEHILYQTYFEKDMPIIASEIMKDKINILIKYNFIPKELEQYINLRKEYDEWFKLLIKKKSDSTILEKENIARTNYIINSEKFLTENPESFLSTKIIVNRATAIFIKYIQSEGNLRKKSYSEMKNALMQPEKLGYLELLEKSKELRSYQIKTNDINEYNKVISDYKTGIKDFNLDIITKDFLIKLAENKIIDKKYLEENTKKYQGGKNE